LKALIKPEEVREREREKGEGGGDFILSDLSTLAHIHWIFRTLGIGGLHWQGRGFSAFVCFGIMIECLAGWYHMRYDSMTTLAYDYSRITSNEYAYDHNWVSYLVFKVEQ
jgi:hypothetical protein